MVDFNPQPGALGAATPGADPQYLALLRALGFDEATQRSIAGQQVGNVQDRLGFEIPRIQSLGVREREGIAGSHEQRGILRSGDFLKADAYQRQDEQYRVGNLYMTGAQDISGIETNLARALADLNRRRAESAITAGGQVYDTDQRSLLNQQQTQEQVAMDAWRRALAAGG